jgi:hypothetical protein
MTRTALALLAGAVLAPATPAFAQAREATTAGFDAQRSHWIRTDPRVSVASIEDGTFTFLWKHTFQAEARGLNSLTQPVLQDFLVGYKGFKSLAVMGAANDILFAIDTDLAKPYWAQPLTFASPAGSVPAGTDQCPGGLTAGPSRVTAMAPALFGGGQGGGGGQRATSAVGEPGKGAAALSQTRPNRPQGPPSGDAPPPPPAGPRRQVPGVSFGGVDPLYVVGSDGLLRTLRITDGGQIDPPAPFLPAFAQPSGVVYVDGFVFASTSNACGNAPNGVWSIDLVAAGKPVKTWPTGGASVGGTAIGTSGIVYASTGLQPANERPWIKEPTPAPRRHASSVVALDRTSLEPSDWFTAAGADFTTSPLVFRHKGKDYVAALAADGRLFLLDGTALGGADHATPLVATAAAGAAGGGLATWVDATSSQRWVLAPIGGAVVAYKVTDAGGKVGLEQGWKSRELAAPLAPIVLNGVVFAASSGEARDAGLSAAERVKRSKPAVLYALDGATGKELWSSGSTITSFARAGLSAGGGQVYLVTHDNTLYAFGIPLEH